MIARNVSTSRSRLVRLWQHLAHPRALFMIAALVLTLAPAAPAVQAAPAAPGAAITAKQTVPFDPAPCPIPAIQGLRVDCGYLTVAESRRNFQGKYIQLAVAILRSPNPNKAADPVVFLAGGPGQAALPLAPVLATYMGPVLAQRDIILVDQRGTGYSRPNLDCSFGENIIGGRFMIGRKQTDESRPLVLQYQVALLRECGARYRAAGIDLTAYNTVENAADLEDLRRALGLGQWNIFGGSYGTRLGLTAMQYRPETIRSAVLDSLYPPQANFHVDVFSSFNRALDLIFTGCAADSACNRAYPNLGAAYDRMIAQLNAAPVQVPIVNLETGELIDYIPVSGVDAALIMFQLAYGTQIIPLFPALIGETARGNYQLLSIVVSALLTAPPVEQPVASLGMQVAVQCNEDVTFATPRDFVVARDSYRRAAPLAHSVLFNEAILEVCSAWGLNNPDPADNRPITSAVRSLLIAGSNDPVTPPAYAQAARATLPNSFYVEYPGGGHTPGITSPCLTAAIAGFLNTPTQAPNTACVAAEAPLPFLIP